MVDWDRVEELRSKGWDWERIADDPKVGFHPDTSVRESGRALRGLYHRQKLRERRQGPTTTSPKKAAETKERRWTLTRIGYLLTPILGVWFTFAYLIPSPVGLLLPAIPYLALGLAVAAFVLLFGLWRSGKERWSKLLRKTVVTGVVIGFVISGLIALGAVLFFGCPYLPSAASATSQPGPGWTSVHVSAWKDNGRVVVYFYGATWCPYCSASSWAVYKALSEFGSVTGVNNALAYSDPGDIYGSTPEVDLSTISFSSQQVSFQVSEYSGDPSGHPFPGTSNCYQQAYVNAYSQASIPFLAVNGQYIHGGSSLINPVDLQTWQGTGAGTVQAAVANEDTSSGSPWLVIQDQAWWTMAFVAKSTGDSVSALASQYHWSSATTNSVTSDLAQIQ